MSTLTPTPPYEIELSADVSSALALLIKMTRKHKVTSLYCTTRELASGTVIFRVSVGDDDEHVEILEDPLWALSVFELVQLRQTGEHSATVMVNQSGYEWVDYQRKGRFARVVYRLLDFLRNSTLALVAVTAFILSLAQLVSALHEIGFFR